MDLQFNLIVSRRELQSCWEKTEIGGFRNPRAGLRPDQRVSQKIKD
jgi:hypothetical protein